LGILKEAIVDMLTLRGIDAGLAFLSREKLLRLLVAIGKDMKRTIEGRK